MTLDEIVAAIGIEPFYTSPQGVIYCGDCLDILPKIPDKAVDLVLTDPPYIGREDLFDTTALPLIQGLIDKMPRIVFWPANISHWGNPTAIHIWHKAIPIHPNSQIGNVAGHHYEQILIYGGGKRCRVIREAAIIPGFAACSDECVKHPTQKPLSLIKELLVDKSADLILDPFLGSGTTAVAAKQLGRKFIGIEINRDYCEIAKQRLAQEELF